MDFLAVERETGDFYVIELKRRASDKTIGQLARYMGWVQDELCKGNFSRHLDNYLRLNIIEERAEKSFPGAILVQLMRKPSCFDAKTGICCLDLPSKLGD